MGGGGARQRRVRGEEESRQSAERPLASGEAAGGEGSGRVDGVGREPFVI